MASVSTVVVSPNKGKRVIPQRKEEYTQISNNFKSISQRFYDVSGISENKTSISVSTNNKTRIADKAVALCLKLDSDYPLAIGQEMIFTSAFISHDDHFLVDLEHPSNIKFTSSGIYCLELIATLEATNEEFIEGNISFYNSAASDDLNGFNTETFDLKNKFLHLKTICNINENEIVNLMFEFRQEIIVCRGAKYLITKISA